MDYTRVDVPHLMWDAQQYGGFYITVQCLRSCVLSTVFEELSRDALRRRPGEWQHLLTLKALKSTQRKIGLEGFS